MISRRRPFSAAIFFVELNDVFQALDLGALKLGKVLIELVICFGLNDRELRLGWRTELPF